MIIGSSRQLCGGINAGHRMPGEEDVMRFHRSLAAARVSAGRAVKSPLNHCPLALCTLLKSQTPGRKPLAELTLPLSQQPNQREPVGGTWGNPFVSSSEKRTHLWAVITSYVGDHCTDGRITPLDKVTLLLILLPSGEKGYPGSFVQNVLEQGQLARNWHQRWGDREQRSCGVMSLQGKGATVLYSESLTWPSRLWRELHFLSPAISAKYFRVFGILTGNLSFLLFTQLCKMEQVLIFALLEWSWEQAIFFCQRKPERQECKCLPCSLVEWELGGGGEQRNRKIHRAQDECWELQYQATEVGQ